MSSWETKQSEFTKSILAGDEEVAVSLARSALEAGATPVEFFENCISPSLQDIGKRFETLDIFLPEMVTAADTVEVVNREVINPAVADANSGESMSLGKVLLATVQGDLHDIGKNMVGLMLKVNGFEVIDLGTNVPPADIVARAEQENVDIIGMSALLTTCLPYMKDVCDFLEGKGIRDKYPVIIGGAATHPEIAEEMGANTHGSSAAEGVEKCKMLLGSFSDTWKEPNIDHKETLMKNRMDYQLLLSALDKAENGPVLDEKEWDRDVIGKNFRETLEKYEITLNKDDPYITADDALADRLYEAGMELAVKTGVYCIDTKRRMQWTQDELEAILAVMPEKVTLGSGDDTATVTHRRPEEDSHVVIYGGPFGIPVSEELFIPLHEAYAREPFIEIFNLGTLLSTRGRKIRAGSPWEAVAAWQEKELAFEILDRVGRPGLAMGCVEIATTEVGELAGTTIGGYRPTDAHKINFISEQKTAYHHLTEAAHYAHVDAFSESYFNPMYGGYVGGGAGVALACVSGSIVMRACYQGTLNNIGPTHVHISASTHPEVLRALQLGLQALARNANFLTSPFIRPTSGPGTKEIFHETGALAVASAVAGCSYIDASQSAAGTHAAHASPLEVKFVAKLTHAVEGMSRVDVGPIVAWMVEKYKDVQVDALIGKPFQKLHDLDTLDPTPEWQEMYLKALDEVNQIFGLSITA